MTSPLSIDFNNGICLQLASYYRLRTGHGGGDMWEHQHQAVLRQNLGGYLPKAIPHGSTSVLFQDYIGGVEICSQSQPVTAANPVPQCLLDGLQAAVVGLKNKALDPSCDPNIRKVIETFRVPDPGKDSELYRLYGTGKNTRLIVLWGVEKHPDTAIPLEDAVKRIPAKQSGLPVWLWPALVVLLFVAIAVIAQRESASETPALSATSQLGSEAQVATLPGTNGVPSSTNAADSTVNRLTTTAATTGGPSTSTVAADRQRITVVASEKSVSTATVSATEMKGAVNEGSKDPNVGKAGVTALSSSSTNEQRAPAGPPPGDVRAVEQENGAMQSQGEGGTTSKSSAIVVPAGSSQNGAGSTPSTAKGAEGTKGSSTGQLPVSGAPSPSASMDMPQESPSGSAAAISETNSASNAAVTKKSGTIPGIPEPMTDATQAASPKVNPPAVAPGSLLTGEVVQGKSSAPPADGKVDTMLLLRAKDSNGNSVSIATISSWKLNGEVQINPLGQIETTNGITVQLTEGKHIVEVTGIAIDDRPVSAKATVNVGIQVRQESTVRVQQAPATP